MAEVNGANIYVDYNGSGSLDPLFHPTLQLCYMQGSIDVPALAPDSSGGASWEFNLPSALTNPFLYCDTFKGATYSFVKISATRWKLVVLGSRGIYGDPIMANSQGPYIAYSNPLNKAGEIKIYYGGYRG